MSSQRNITQTFSFALRCPDHRQYGSLPCPWPDCPNGVEESILVGNVPGTNTVQTYRRVEWPAFEDQVYYSWEEDSMPAWFAADRIISQEAERRLLAWNDHVGTIYHYTSVAALACIVEDCSLWLTDFAYFNDATELKHGISLAEHAIREAVDARTPGRNPPFLDNWLSIQSHSRPRICMACFSLDGDNLSQWRSYGEVSIGFGWPFDLGYLPETLLGRVVYDDAIQQTILRLFIHHHGAAFFYDEKQHGQKVLESYDSLDRLYRRLVFLKNPAFVDEREARLVYFEDPDLFRRLGQATAPKRFRTKGNLVIPYVRSADLARRAIQHLPIQEVIVGPQPNSDLVQSGIQELLAARGYSAVTVRQSRIPYRSIGAY